MHWVQDSGERERIRERLRCRAQPWRNLFPQDAAEKLSQEYAFRDNFDLCGALSEVIWRYKSRKERCSPSPFADSEMQAGEFQSMETSVAVALWQTTVGKRETQSSVSRKLAAAARYFRAKPKSPGRTEDTAAISFFRSLGAIYASGTGKAASPTRNRGKGFRGQPYRFFLAVKGTSKLDIKETHLLEMGAWTLEKVRKYRQKKR